MREQEEILLSPMTKSLHYMHWKIDIATRQHTNATTNFDYTTIADRHRTVSWSNDSHSTGVVKPVYGSQPSHQPRKLCNQEDSH